MSKNELTELELEIQSILLKCNFKKDIVYQFFRTGANKNDQVIKEMLHRLEDYLEKRPLSAQRILSTNMAQGILGVETPASELVRRLESIYGPVVEMVNADANGPFVEGSAASGQAAKSRQVFRFEGAQQSDLDTLVKIPREKYRQLYNAYIRAKYPTVMEELAAYLDREMAGISIDEVGTFDIPKTKRGYMVSKYGQLLQLKKNYDKGILFGADMVDVGWVDSADLQEIKALVGRETTVSVVCEGSSFDPATSNAVEVDLSLTKDQPSLTLALKISLVVAGIGIAAGVGKLIHAVVNMHQNGVSYTGIQNAISGGMGGIVSAETVRQLLYYGDVAPIVGRIGGAMAIADGVHSLITAIQRGDGYRTVHGGIEITAGIALVTGYCATGGILLGGLTIADGIKTVIDGEVLSGSIRIAAGGCFTAAAVVAMIPGVGPCVAVGLGAAGLTALLIDVVVTWSRSGTHHLYYYGPYPIRYHNPGKSLTEHVHGESLATKDSGIAIDSVVKRKRVEDEGESLESMIKRQRVEIQAVVPKVNIASTTQE